MSLINLLRSQLAVRLACACAVVFMLATTSTAIAGEPVLLFADDFERDESVPGKEEIGNGWRSNTAWRAKGQQQVDLVDGAMHVTRYPAADHGVAIFHDAEFQDGRVELRFQLGTGDSLGVDFVDRELKTVHAGHLCVARINLKSVTLVDSKTGAMDLEVRQRRKAGEQSPELTALLKSKQRRVPVALKPGQWYALTVAVVGDEMTVQIDGETIGRFRSEGIGHPTKRMITLAVNQSAQIDDLKIWRFK